MAASPYKNTGRHPVDLDDGRVLEPGHVAEVEVSAKHPLAQHLVETGQLTKVRSPKDDGADVQVDSTPTTTAAATVTKEKSR